MALTGSLPDAVQFSRKDVYTLTWTYDDDTRTPVNLTGSTLMGIIERDGVPTLITGALALVTAASGIFSWTRSEADVAQAGTFFVQFYARYTSDSSKPMLTFRTKWHVLPGFDFPFVSPSVSPSASVSLSASPSASS